MMYGWDGSWGIGGWIAMALMVLLFWGSVVAVVILLLRGPRGVGWGGGHRQPWEDAERILNARFARREADSVDTNTGVAWSIMVKSRAAESGHTEDVPDSAAQLLFPWEAGSKDHFVRITADSITGRRFKVSPPRAWSISLDDATRAGLE
ncbi:hypothetical protein LVY72_09585 [Arthrobacter sp. I2-34]|uniref:DUF2550 domain-containing protein n=1 Tax=Arthrobacter hankyongi TaxID=2904801 RepID=A0ABS9L6Q9_9MICC|nr:hypothetical protein [Arthrobacter hankyongi]MCG2622169.1 hypothetical protein [Arthrobacter hankyongi]